MKEEYDDYMTYTDGDLVICDHICQACAYKFKDDTACCEKFPDGKPTELLAPEYYCTEFSMVDLDKD